MFLPGSINAASVYTVFPSTNNDTSPYTELSALLMIYAVGLRVVP